MDARSTLVALLLSDTAATSIHVGDSRVMQFSEGSLVAQSSDHSQAQLLVSRGELSGREVAGHPAQAQLLSSVGGPGAPSAQINRWDPSYGMRFVVCTDGFWSIFTHAETLALFSTVTVSQPLGTGWTVSSNHCNTTTIARRF